MKFSTFLIVCITCVIVFASHTYTTESQVMIPDEISQLSWSPDGASIAIAGGQSGCDPEKRETEFTVRILDVSTQTVTRRLIRHDCRLVSIDWNLDGTKIVSSSFDGEMVIWDVSSGDVLTESEIRPEMGLGVFWSPDSTKIASIGGGKYAIVWSGITGEILYNSPKHSETTTSVVWSPDGTKLATSSNDRTILISDSTTQEDVLIITHSDRLYWVDWSPDGSKLASGSTDASVQIWDADSGKLLNTLNGHSDSVVKVLWNSDSNQVASASLDESIVIWDAVTGEQISRIKSETGPIRDFEWSPDGTQIAYAGIYAGQGGGEARIVIVSLEEIKSACIRDR